MAQGIATVWVPVQEMSRAVAFYRDVLNLDVASESDEWSEIEAGGLKIGLNAHEPASASSEGGAVITFQPETSIEDELERIRASEHGELTGEISEHPWGRIFPFKDSEGNDLQFYSPPTGD